MRDVLLVIFGMILMHMIHIIISYFTRPKKAYSAFLNDAQTEELKDLLERFRKENEHKQNKE